MATCRAHPLLRQERGPYRAVSIGSDPSLPEAVAFTNEAASLKPYAPVHIRGSRNGGGDVTIVWIRRTRFSGEWRDLVDGR
jgi:hypothetical protein